VTAQDPLQTLVRDAGLDATGVPGEPGDSIEYRVDAERTVGLLAATLRRLHDLDIGGLDGRAHHGDGAPPGMARVDRAEDVVARVESAFAAGELDDRERSPAYAHIPLDRLVRILSEGAATAEERATTAVVLHGRPTLSRLWCRSGVAVGLVDWTDLAIGDRYLDLAVAIRSIAADLAPVLVPVFVERYGLEHPDPILLDWYSLAAELSWSTP
jgi:aminoglycoside phosphotransferase